MLNTGELILGPAVATTTPAIPVRTHPEHRWSPSHFVTASWQGPPSSIITQDIQDQRRPTSAAVPDLFDRVAPPKTRSPPRVRIAQHDGSGPDADLVKPASHRETPVGSVITHLKGSGLGQRHDARVTARGSCIGQCQVAPGRPIPVRRDEDSVPGATEAEDELSLRHPGQV